MVKSKKAQRELDKKLRDTVFDPENDLEYTNAITKTERKIRDVYEPLIKFPKVLERYRESHRSNPERVESYKDVWWVRLYIGALETVIGKFVMISCVTVAIYLGYCPP